MTGSSPSNASSNNKMSGLQERAKIEEISLEEVVAATTTDKTEVSK